ncbi:serine hydroxymethyltransferase [bacterium]|nr:serine hydroxymethyltransferase [bacterium]
MSYFFSEDKEVENIVHSEISRLEEGLELIASENVASKNVMLAQGSPLTNKYAEGYPSKRYYGGCEEVDKVENLAISRAKSIFNCSYVNVQPHSGSQANQAVYSALLEPGDTILSLSLSDGGHLSHGHFVTQVGKIFKISNYSLDERTELIDFDKVKKVAFETKPKLIICGYSNYSRKIDFSSFRDIADQVGAYLLGDIAHISGIVAAGKHPSPFPHCHIATTTTHKTLRGPRGGMILSSDPDIAKKIDKAVFPGMQGGPLMHVIAAKAVAFREAASPSFKNYINQVLKNAKHLSGCLSDQGLRIVSGGTDNHLFSCDLRNWKLTGKEAEALLGDAGITVNKNTIPNDPQSPFVTSGIRIGTPAITTRGMKETEMKEISNLVVKALKERVNPAKIKKEVLELCQKFPLYT